MVLQSGGNAADGPLHRITWTPLADKSVRQLWQTQPKAGTYWTTMFDGKYVPRPN
ncbi:MAG: hypothetical protein ABJA83_13125 [Burkholderiaceae bacterium]